MKRLSPRFSDAAIGLTLALLLGAGFLVLCVWWTLADLIQAISGDLVTSSMVRDQVVGPVLGARLVWFAVALVVVHLSLGLTAFGLARMTVTAAPRFAAGRSVLLVLLWFILLVAIALTANTHWYPASRFSPEISWLQSSWHGVQPIHGALAVFALLVIALATRAFLRRQPGRPRAVLLVSTGLLLFLIVGLLNPGVPFAARPAAAYASPHIVFIGLDSLRNDLADGRASEPLTPNVDAFLQGAHRFSDTTSPLARTFPALVSLLTGRHPVTSHARFNLMPRVLVQEGDTLGDVLQARGYHTVFATDEVRFANFDESYGFDQLITPPVGASDFLLGQAGDLPLVNLLSPARLAAWLFPSSHANRAAALTYRPAGFLNKLDREFSLGQPAFLFVHLTLAHWPYNWAGLPEPSTPPAYRAAYHRAVTAVDLQFSEVMRLLERKGILENAIVIVLSDHGDALGWPTDSMLRKTGTPIEIWDSLWGHGTSVMSPHQYGVLLAMRGYGRAQLPGIPAAHAWPVSLEDVRPTVQELATGSAPEKVDGISLVRFLGDPEAATTLDERVRFTETDFSTPMVLAGQYDPAGLIQEGAAYYEIVPETGWVQLRPNRIPELIGQKQRAAISRNSLLAAIPSRTDDSVTYLFTDRRSPLPRRLPGRPDPLAEPEAARLWDALHARFPGELADIADLP